MEKILKRWQLENFITTDQFNTIRKDLRSSERYLKTTFRINLQTHSPTTSHCIQNALNDAKLEIFQTPCNENQHAFICEHCKLLNQTLDQIEDWSNQRAVELADTLRSIQADQDAVEVQWAVEDILKLQRHIIRAVQSERERRTILQQLSSEENSGTLALLTLDYAQKLLPRYFLETQRQYFGKTGMSYHIGHLMASVSNKYISHTFVHIMESWKQVR